MNVPRLTGVFTHRAMGESLAQRSFWQEACAWWGELLRLRKRQSRSLRVCESLSLGERRFVAVVAYGGRQFLLGGTSTSLGLLTELTTDTEHEQTPRERSAERVRCEEWK